MPAAAAHINGAGTVNGNFGVHPLACELGNSIGELMSSFRRSRTC